MLIEIVNDNPNEEVKGEKGAKYDEDDKVEVHVEVDFSAGLFLHLQKVLMNQLSAEKKKKKFRPWRNTLTPLESTAAFIISIHPLNVA